MELSKLGTYIKEVDVRNTNNDVSNLIGVSISKDFINSVANVIGTDLSKYKIIKEGEFACSLMQVSRDGGVAVGLYKNEEKSIMSPAYYIFEVDKNKILPEYLDLIFKNPEFDREAVFNAIGGVRGTLTWEDFCDIPIMVPNIDNQKEIIKTINIIKDRTTFLDKSNKILDDMICAIYDKYIVNNEKSSEWEMEPISKHATCVLGGTPSRNNPDYWNGNINWINSGEVNKFRITESTEKISEQGLRKSSTSLLPKGTTVLAITGVTLGQISRLEIDTCANQSVIGVLADKDLSNDYLYMTLNNNIEDIITNQTGGAQPHINKGDVEDFEILIPPKDELEKYNSLVSPIFNKISYNCWEIKRLKEFENIIVQKLIEE